MDYILETFIDGKQQLGSDFSRIVRDVRSNRKIDNAKRALVDSLFKLKKIKPYMIGATIEIKTTKL